VAKRVYDTMEFVEDLSYTLGIRLAIRLAIQKDNSNAAEGNLRFLSV
jgi:hypothetical protein